MCKTIKSGVLVFLLTPLLSFGQSNDCVKGSQTFESIDINCILSSKYQKLLNKVVSREQRRKKALAEVDEAIKASTTSGERAKYLKRKDKVKARQNLIFSIASKNKVKELKNNIYFYRTSSGHHGKMIIRNIDLTRMQCSMYVDTVTYEGTNIVKKSITFVTENVSNSWNVDKASFDNRPGSDFLLRRENGRCVFKSISSVIARISKLKEEEEIDDNEIIIYTALFLIGLAVFLVARTIFQDEDRFKAQEKLEDAEQTNKDKTPNDIILKYSRPFFKRYFSPIVLGMKNKRKIKEKYKRPLASSGMNQFLTPEDFYAFKLFLIIGFPIIYLGLRAFLEEDWPLIYTPMISVFGFFYPDIWIKGKISERRTNIIENMPFIVDMLALSVEAGLDFVAAIQKVIEKAPSSALVEEFEILIKDTRVGASRAEGLRQMSWRIDALAVSSFCATLIAADSVGANIGPILKTLAQELREKRSSLAEQKGAQAATKILIPMIFLVLPAVLLIIAAPIALQLMGN